MTSASFQEHPPGTGSSDETTSSPLFELGAQIFLLLLSVAILVNSLALGLVVPLGPGAGFFPFFLSIALGLLTIAWFVQSRREAAAARAQDQEPSTSSAVASTESGTVQISDESSTERNHVINVIVSLVLLGVLMIPLGFQIPMFIFIVYHLWFRARRRWYTVLVIALVGSVGVFHMFNDLLSVALPYSSIELLNLIGL